MDSLINKPFVIRSGVLLLKKWTNLSKTCNVKKSFFNFLPLDPDQAPKFFILSNSANKPTDAGENIDATLTNRHNARHHIS